MVDYILKVNSQQQLTYIGHSQGTMIAFAALSTNTALANKIKLFVALAPVATLGNITNNSLLKYGGNKINY